MKMIIYNIVPTDCDVLRKTPFLLRSFWSLVQQEKDKVDIIEEKRRNELHRYTMYKGS